MLGEQNHVRTSINFMALVLWDKWTLNKFPALVRKNNNFAEFKADLIHRKQVPLLHNTVLILRVLISEK